MAMEPIKSKLTSFYLWIKLLWLHLNQLLCRWMNRPFLFRSRRSPLYHSVVCIGDGYIEGFGDWIIAFNNGGITDKLPKILRQKSSVRQYWTFVNAGHYHSTSFDWLPDCEEKPTQLTLGVGKSLWSDTFGSHSSDVNALKSEIAILCVGGSDHLYARKDGDLPHKTVENIKTICNELVKMGKIVIVSPIPLGLGGYKRVERDERNKLLQEWLNTKPQNIYQGPDINTPLLRLPHYSLDHYHLSSHGYTLWSNMLVECVKNHMLQIEWKSYQEIWRQQKPEGKEKSRGEKSQGEKKEE
ncbi:hypothetical protein PROFUN_00608 [Planoprotostelium fungivorum]|uniref:SGNH hydrolase-type esterase domain-containing protein n=1 Tax=Planoprotostelium fungivorum TaxID=1890364 RepID=A0A2P6NTU7_9EUKA|nr:hypothetical protein PROFUN_00608 [Planoprotostelium fungivorum]